MICGSCRRRCDPNRSFCTNCGSSVFIAERDAASFFGGFIPQVSSSSPVAEAQRQWSALKKSAQSFDRRAVADAATAFGGRTARRARKAPPPSINLAPLIKLAVFVFVVWYVAGWLRTIPEVIMLKDRLQAGHFSDADLQAARDAIGDRIQTFL